MFSRSGKKSSGCRTVTQHKSHDGGGSTDSKKSTCPVPSQSQSRRSARTKRQPSPAHQDQKTKHQPRLPAEWENPPPDTSALGPLTWNMKHAQGDTTPSLPSSSFPPSGQASPNSNACPPPPSAPTETPNPTATDPLYLCRVSHKPPTPGTTIHPNPPQRAPRPSPPYLAASGIEHRSSTTTPLRVPADMHAGHVCPSVHLTKRLDINVMGVCV